MKSNENDYQKSRIEIAIERSGQYPKNGLETEYCAVTGKAFAEGDSYYNIAGEEICEELHQKIFSEEEWGLLSTHDPEKFYYSDINYVDDVAEVVPDLIDYSDNSVTYWKDGKNIGNRQEIALSLLNDEEIEGIENTSSLLKDILIEDAEYEETIEGIDMDVDVCKKYGLTFEFAYDREFKNEIQSPEKINDDVIYLDDDYER